MDYGAGKRLIFLHGWGGEIASFKGLADRLSARFRITLIDLYGFGKTPHPDHPLCIEDYARGVEDVIKTTGGGKVILVGHSFGGRIAMRLAATNAEVVGLVLIDSAGVIPRRGLRYYWRVARYKLAKKLDLKNKPLGSSDFAALSGAIKGTFINVVNESSIPDAKRIAVPTLLLWGSEDRDTPLYMCRKLQKSIADCEEVIFEGAGHFSYLDRPDRSYLLIKAFAEGV